MSSPPDGPAARAVATTESDQSRNSPGTNCGNAGSTLGPVLLSLVLILAGAVVAGPVAASGGPVAFDHVSPNCDEDSRDRRLKERAGQIAFVDTLVNDSSSDWNGGQVVRVGASGDCSLAVTNGTATLTAATVNETGVVTGVVDLGENGSLRLVGPNRTAQIAERYSTTASDGYILQPTPREIVEESGAAPLFRPEAVQNLDGPGRI